MRYLVKILLKLGNLVSCLPPVAKSLVCDSQWLLSGYFCKPSKNAVTPGQWKSKHIWNWFGCDVVLWGRDESAWGQTSILGHVWPSIAFWPLTKIPTLWPHAYSLWLLKVMRALELTPDLIHTHRDRTEWRQTVKSISKLFWFSLTWHNCIFAWLTKIATHWLLTVTHQWFCNWGKDKILIYLIKIEFWPNTSYFLI